ncbi:hypothetical protein [Flavobacterium sp. J27]|uniref:hypothetical protein n=1 Tax=Flavobacterium sp. J27 TaxID=2060419 RepID=UPI00102F5328|nr:hypothetical protein [Flavobacterium sp. J27]
MKKIPLLFLFLSQIIFSQTLDWNMYKETIAIQVNAKTLITGEKLWYSIYCLGQNNQKSQLSNVAYVTCIDQSGKEIFLNKHYLENGTNTGYFFIPTNLKTGTYQLLAYTQWMLNASPVNYTSSQILIINPYNENKQEKELFDTIVQTPINNIENTPKEYTKRKWVTISDFVTNETGNFTISVRKTNAINAAFEEKFAKPNETINFAQTKEQFPETKGELISGRLKRLDSLLPLNNISIALLDKGNKDYINITTTNKNGHFYFILAKPLHSKNIYFEIINENNNYVIEINPKLQPQITTKRENLKIQLLTNYSKEIEKRAIAAQIENAFYEIKKDSTIIPALTNSINPNYLEVFPIEKYTRFSSLKEFITEVLNQVYFTEKNNQFKIHFRNSGVNLELNENPLTLVDGTIIINPNDLLKIEYKKIKSIATNIQPYYLGNKLYSGIFIIHTTEASFDDISNKKWPSEYIIPLYKQQQYTPDYQKNTALDKIPDYRTQLLWQKTSSLNQPFSFYTSDVEGIYEISIYGYTNEGLFIAKSSYFKIN